MPLSNGKYVSPTWKNGAAPALDAAELQAITDTLAGDQQAVGALQESVTALQGNAVQIATGSYTGTGATDKVSVTLPFVPKFFAVAGARAESNKSQFAFCTGTPSHFHVYETNNSGTVDLSFTISGRTISWTTSKTVKDPANILNISGNTYRYFAIG